MPPDIISIARLAPQAVGYFYKLPGAVIGIAFLLPGVVFKAGHALAAVVAEIGDKACRVCCLDKVARRVKGHKLHIAGGQCSRDVVALGIVTKKICLPQWVFERC